MNQVQDDEIDLFELFQMLWNGKWLISAFVGIAVLLGGGFFLSKDAVYVSKLIYSVNIIPPFYEAGDTTRDFNKKFYSASVFEGWKQNNNNTTIVFEDFSKTQVVDGFVLSTKIDNKLARLGSENKGQTFILVMSNQLRILDDFYKYAIHINGLLSDEYVTRAKKELTFMKASIKKLSTSDSKIVNDVLMLDRYILVAEKNENALTIERPTVPKKISPRSFLILAMSVVLGGTVGVLFILVRNAITKRKERLAKA